MPDIEAQIEKLIRNRDEAIEMCIPSNEYSSEETARKIAKLMPQWIPVSERLPEHNTECIGALFYEGKVDEYYLVKYWDHGLWGNPAFEEFSPRIKWKAPDVWMPLDALPEPEQEK